LATIFGFKKKARLNKADMQLSFAVYRENVFYNTRKKKGNSRLYFSNGYSSNNPHQNMYNNNNSISYAVNATKRWDYKSTTTTPIVHRKHAYFLCVG